MSPTEPLRLTEVQRLPTHGARAVEAFAIDGRQYLAVPQLARDLPGQAPTMTGGDSDVDSLLYRWQPGSGFVLHQRLPICGGEDAEHFRIGRRRFLATASLRAGHGPYRMAVESVIFEWTGDRFEPFQRLPTMAAKQWTFFAFDGRSFLALAQGAAASAEAAPADARSTVFEWDGERFVPLQSVPSAWGYNWARFDIDGQRYLAHADHTAPSCVLRWSGSGFEPCQTLDGDGGRAFCFFSAAGGHWLAFARLLGDTVLYRWSGGRWAHHQVLSGPGGRELRWLPDPAAEGGGRLLQVNFIRGSREQPVPQIDSVFYGWAGGRLRPVQTLPTSGGTDAACFTVGGQPHLAIANSLSAEARFAAESCIYRLHVST